MKKVNNCVVENCIPTPSSCVEWNGGTIEYLGICDGDSLNNLLWEVITKLQAIAGQDLSSFDIDSLLDICGTKAPTEVTILSILNVVKANQICLKDFIDKLAEQLAELFADQGVNVNLKCYTQFDNLGNSLSITRDTLDQLVIDNLCAQKLRIETLEGKVTDLQSQIDIINNNTTVDELSFATCVNPAILATSQQVINTSTAFCDHRAAVGLISDIAIALSLTPTDLNAEFGLISGWTLTPANWAQNYGNMVLEVENLRQRIISIETNCCVVTCKDVELGFSAIFSDTNDSIIIRFTSGAGTDIPNGFEDIGSTITLTDEDGNIEEFNTSTPPNTIANNSMMEVETTALKTTGDVNINIQANMSNGALTCSKCLNKTIKRASCNFCVLTASGDVTIVYKICSSTTSS